LHHHHHPSLSIIIILHTALCEMEQCILRPRDRKNPPSMPTTSHALRTGSASVEHPVGSPGKGDAFEVRAHLWHLPRTLGAWGGRPGVDTKDTGNVFPCPNACIFQQDPNCMWAFMLRCPCATACTPRTIGVPALTMAREISMMPAGGDAVRHGPPEPVLERAVRGKRAVALLSDRKYASAAALLARSLMREGPFAIGLRYDEWGSRLASEIYQICCHLASAQSSWQSPMWQTRHAIGSPWQRYRASAIRGSSG
jgi:hypothetical protein